MRNLLGSAWRKWLLALVLISLMAWAPAIAQAHEKWFVDPAAYPIQWNLLVSVPVLIAAVGAAAALGALLLLRRLVRDPLWPNPEWLRPIQSSAPAVIGIQT